MASTIVQVRLPLAETAGMTLRLYPAAGGAIANGAGGDALSQVDGDDPFFYQATVTEALAGDYQWVVILSGGTHAAFGPDLVTLADDVGPYLLESTIAGAILTVTAIAATVQAGAVESPKLLAYLAAKKTWSFSFVDQDGGEIDVDGDTLRLDVEDESGTTIFTKSAIGSGNAAVFVVTAADQTPAGLYQYAVRNETNDDEVLAANSYQILAVPS